MLTRLINKISYPICSNAFSSLLIKNGIVLNHDYKSKCDVLVEDEKIKKLVPHGT